MERDVMRDRVGEFVVWQGAVGYGVGGFIVGAGMVLAVLEGVYHIGRIPVWVYLVIVGMVLFGVLVGVEAFNRRLVVEGEKLCYRNMFGRVKEFQVKDVGSVKAADDFSKGRDYLKLYDKEGKLLCRLECGMKNGQELMAYLYDRGITFETEPGKGSFLAELLKQEVIGQEVLGKRSGEVYKKTEQMVGEWQREYEALGAEFSYGFVEEGETEQEKYVCRLELYVQKEGCLVCDRKGQLLMMKFPVFYKRRTGVVGESKRLYYNRGWQKEAENAMRSLAEYLPRHRFYLEEETREIVLKRSVKGGIG